MKKHLRIDEQVFWLNIAVDDVRSVAECDAFNHLVREEAQAFGLFHTVRCETKFKIEEVGGPSVIQILRSDSLSELPAEFGQKFLC